MTGWIFFQFMGLVGNIGGFYIFLIYTIILALLWVPSLVERVGRSGGSLFWPSDDRFTIRPQYSIAQAREKEGDIVAAIKVYNDYKVTYPEEVTPYLRIAHLYVIHFRDGEAALTELRAGMDKARDLRTQVMIYQRLADIYMEFRKDPSSALANLQEIQRKFPGTRWAKKAARRARFLVDDMTAAKEKATGHSK